MAENKCIKCSSSSKELALIKIEVNGKDAFVCTGCLPILIHGG